MTIRSTTTEKPGKACPHEPFSSGDWASLILVPLAALAIRRWVFSWGLVTSASMEPTLHAGDRILIRHRPQQKPLLRGDIVIFRSRELKKNLAKRVIGLPGETVSWKNGTVFIGDRALHEPQIQGSFPGEGRVTVPEGCYFLLGDNRLHSLDSRSWKAPFIASKDIRGVVWGKGIFPVHRI